MGGGGTVDGFASLGMQWRVEPNGLVDSLIVGRRLWCGKQPVAEAISVELKRTVPPPHFDHLVGVGAYDGRNVEAQRPRGSAAFALGRVLVRAPRVAGARALADHVACGRRGRCIDRLRQRSEFRPGGADPFEYGQKVLGVIRESNLREAL